MSMSTFLFAADALRIEEGVSWTLTPSAGSRPSAPDPTVGNRNAQAMAAFTGGLAGVQMKKGKR
jgi:hypothetical protein